MVSKSGNKNHLLWKVLCGNESDSRWGESRQSGTVMQWAAGNGWTAGLSRLWAAAAAARSPEYLLERERKV